MEHENYMRIALAQAQAAFEKDEVPIGAVLVDRDGEILSKTHNCVVHRSDPTAHAEMLAIREGSGRIANYRLLNTVLYVTVEPCVMCMGAIVHARIERVVYGAPDPKWGAAGSVYDFSTDRILNHRPEVVSGVCLDACRMMMQEFFRFKRNKE